MFLFEKQRARGKPLDQKAKVMAIYRCNLHPARASAMDHSRYIAREGRYSDLAQERSETICHGTGNLPEWANADASRFWEAAEKHERANANHYREFEVALPRELSHEQMEATVKGFSQDQFGERHAYQYALHLNANNPHAHIMFSEKMNDGLSRSEEQYFKRYNPKKPECGGCKKSNEWEAQRGNKASDRLLQAREAWANHVNRALERAGHEARVDHRSYEARGIDQIPQPKVGPKVWHQPNREQHPRFQEFEAVRLANQAPQERANLAAIEANLGAAERELAEITAALKEIEANQQKAQEKAAPPRSPEVERVWFACFDRSWKIRGGSQRILSREMHSPEVQARISLEMPPKCVLSEEGRTWSGIFRNGIEANDYGRERREQALVEAQARAAERKAQEPPQHPEPPSPTWTERVLQALSKAAQAKARANVATTQEPAERAPVPAVEVSKPVQHQQAPEKRPEMPQDRTQQQPPKAQNVQQRAKESDLANAEPPLVDRARKRFAAALRAVLEADQAYKASFRVPRDQVAAAMAAALKTKVSSLEHAKAAARDCAAVFGPTPTLSFAKEQLGREKFDLVREFETVLGLGKNLGRGL